MPASPLTDGELAALARQAVDLVDPDVEIDIEPDEGADPYRWSVGAERAWVVWPRFDGRRSFGVHVYSNRTPIEALAELVEAVGEGVSESTASWGRPFPPCPGHSHPAHVAADGAEVVLTCPSTGAEVGRIRPDAPPGP